jgi:hypothetical protein
LDNAIFHVLSSNKDLLSDKIKTFLSGIPVEHLKEKIESITFYPVEERGKLYVDYLKAKGSFSAPVFFELVFVNAKTTDFLPELFRKGNQCPV